ncbi:MAG: putative DNA binding domain-containing protein [Prevotella sp.]|nr:putative DNA binding domain-containing protein [Prevotella sp.]
MTYEDIQQLKSTAEETRLQMKERIIDKYDIGCELVALSNSRGGDLVIGVNDKTGEANPLTYKEVQETTAMLGNLASGNVVPPVLLDIENVKVNGGAVVVAHVKEGLNKPYRDNKGVVWVKNGADKRKVFDNAELAEMMTECGNYAPDETGVKDITLDDLDEATIKEFLANKFKTVLAQKGMIGDKLRKSSINEVCGTIVAGHDLNRLFRNLRFIRPDGQLTCAAVLLFAKYTQRWLHTMTAKCICYVGNSIAGTQFRDKVDDADMEGNLLHQFNIIMAFFKRNLKSVQTSEEFNSQGQLEIPYISIVEFTVNALVHRSLNWNAPIRIFIFDDRVEIHSPGALPNGLSVDDIVAGTSMPRNAFLFSNAIYLLPYTGVGSGIQRAVSNGLDVQFTNSEAQHEFLITIPRKGNQGGKENNQVKGDNKVRSTRQGKKETNLTKRQRDIVNFCSVPRSAGEIMARIGLTNQSKNKAKYILPLVEAGYLEMTNPDNPKVRNQKYRAIIQKD